MLTITGKNSPTKRNGKENSSSQNGSANHGTKDDNKTIKSNLSHRERVQRLIENIKKKQESKPIKIKSEYNALIRSTGASFQNRFQAQKTIIEMQRSKLMEQEKIINELKMGILSKEERNEKYDIKELFQDCRMRLLGKVPLDYIPKNEDFLVKTQTAPKIILEMEKRALERMRYREIIKERRKCLEETKKQIQEENLRRKHQLEEEEKLKHLEMLNERHKQEQERMKKRQIQKEMFLRNWNKAVYFHEKTILRKSFRFWKSEYVSSLNKLKISEDFYKIKILGKFFRRLFVIVNSRNLKKREIADDFRRKNLLKRSWHGFKENYVDGIRSWQVAEDFNDFRIERKYFSILCSFISKERILRDIKDQQASYHYRRKLLFYSFYGWKSLPLVLKMEKVKEERKEKWRQKVLEILPDFSPPAF